MTIEVEEGCHIFLPERDTGFDDPMIAEDVGEDVEPPPTPQSRQGYEQWVESPNAGDDAIGSDAGPLSS